MDFLRSNTNYPIQHRSNFGRNALIALVVTLILGTGGAAAYFYKKYSSVKDTPANRAQVDTQGTIAAVGKLIVLPTNEDPTVATVTDPAKLTDQVFFAHAKVGDKVLLYVKAKKAILYDPTANKLIEVAPLNLDDSNKPRVSGGTTTETK